MATRKASLILPVAFDGEKTDLESLASAIDRLMETALSMPGILDEYGVVEIGPLELPRKKRRRAKGRA